jgi:hypothetical protein
MRPKWQACELSSTLRRTAEAEQFLEEGGRPGEYTWRTSDILFHDVKDARDLAERRWADAQRLAGRR